MLITNFTSFSFHISGVFHRVNKTLQLVQTEITKWITHCQRKFNLAQTSGLNRETDA